MNPSSLRLAARTVAFALFATFASGCAAASGAEGASEDAAPAAVRTFGRSEGDVRAESRVTRSVRADGSELLRGLATIARADGPVAVVAEEAQIASNGRLLRAVITTTVGDVETSSMTLDGTSGEILDGLSGRVVTLTTDAPLVYGPLSVLGEPFASPVAAWVAVRAADRWEHLRLVDFARPEASVVTTRSQVVVRDGHLRWVALGDEAVGVDAELVHVLPLDLVAPLRARSAKEERRASRM